jgi:hypothetical protein
MDLDNLAKLGEFVGGFFVVVSLIYLANQVRQNTKSLRTENYARVLDRMSTLQSKLSSDPELNRIVVVGAQTPEAMTRLERTRFSWALYELFGAVEFMYHQAQEDALPKEVWRRWRATTIWWLSHPGIRAWWAAKPVPLSGDFEAFADDAIRNHPVDAEAMQRWNLFVVGESPPGMSEPLNDSIGDSASE